MATYNTDTVGTTYGPRLAYTIPVTPPRPTTGQQWPRPS